MKGDWLLRLRDLTKRYGNLVAVDALSLEIRGGEIFALLGPSGCGKTTTLRVIAGLEIPDAGEVLYRDRVLVSVARRRFVAPEKRDVGMVFQSYAIWPHMTVFENVAYPLRLRGFRGARLRDKVVATLETVGLRGVESRPAPLLSGGQQQRVALARALVYEPEILLLDEPLSNLDAKLREQMRVELKLLQRQLGLTMIVVTHDQIEALSLSDRLAVLSRGRVEQVGTPRELYERPETSFVRDFLGKCVTLRGRLVEGSGAIGCVELPAAGGGLVYERQAAPGAAAAGTPVLVSVRPEDIRVVDHPGGSGANVIKGTVEALLYVGDRTECRVRVGDEQVMVYVPRGRELRHGECVFLHLPLEALRIWPGFAG
jgi:ABC-type Fe3+/spermidine/putrescine transport system ATPase subunit